MSEILISLTNKQKLYKKHELLPLEQHGKIYVDLPHRFFSNLEDLKRYTAYIKSLGANVVLLLPHFLPSFSEYVVKDYEKVCKLFGDWQSFADYTRYVKSLCMHRMIDIPLNHADWNANNLRREWYISYERGGIEAGADDVDADGNRIRINWGAYILDNSNYELVDYWIDKVIIPHVEKYNIDSIRIDAAWALDSSGLRRLVQKSKAKCKDLWFLAENLGMDKLINLAKSALEAGADRFFNNMYWYQGGKYIPFDIYNFYKKSGGVPTCSIFSSHDTLMPALRAYAKVHYKKLGLLSEKALYRKVIEYDKLETLDCVDKTEQMKVVNLMELDFLLFAFMSTDLMFVAGSEKCLLKKVDVTKTMPSDFKLGIETSFPETITKVLHIKQSHEIFCKEGVIIPFGVWNNSDLGVKGYVKSNKKQHLFVAVNTNLEESKQVVIPKRLLASKKVYEVNFDGIYGPLDFLNSSTILPAGKALVLIAER